MARFKPSVKVIEKLKHVYSAEYHSSSYQLQVALKKAFADEEGKFRGTAGPISEKTIRNILQAAEIPEVQDQTMNYLCRFLLKVDSYQDAVQQLNAIAPNDAAPATPAGLDISVWLTDYREYLKEKCKVKTLDFNKSTEVEHIYAEVKVLGSPQRQQQKAYSEVIKLLAAPEAEANLRPTLDKLATASDRRQNGLDVVRQHSQLMVLGRPGSGKTTLLKRIAWQTLEANFSAPAETSQPAGLPIFIRLHDFAKDSAKPTLQQAVLAEFAQISGAQPTVQALMQQGQLLVLLDGLDEVMPDDVERIYTNIEDFIRQYPGNRLVISCRTAAREYFFEGFTLVEVAEFDENQIAEFVNNWFVAESEVAEQFLAEINKNINESVKELTKTPLLLTILCWVFEVDNKLPRNRHELYRDMADVLLRRLDGQRRIKRNMPYADRLTHQRLLDLFCTIAYDAFSQDPPKVLWRRSELEDEIKAFIETLLGSETANLDTTSEQILQAIQANMGLLVEEFRGLYSFAHLTFQEYFAGREIAQRADPERLQTIVRQHLTDRRWREVFLVISGRLRNCDDFFKLIFQQIVGLSQPPEIQTLLRWLDRVTEKHGVASPGWRSLYLASSPLPRDEVEPDLRVDHQLTSRLAYIIREVNRERGAVIEQKPKSSLARDLLVVHHRAQALLSLESVAAEKTTHSDAESVPFLVNRPQYEPDRDEILNYYAHAIEIARNLNADLADQLEALLNSFNEAQALGNESLEARRARIEKLRQLMINHLDVGYEFPFTTPPVVKTFNDYLYVCNLLVDCMRGDSVATPKLRNQMLDHLLLPVERIPESLLP